MSSIRLFILGTLAERGAMHGHQLRLLAEEEHVHLWTDITVGAVYGAIKRLATEQLIESVRVEREGSYPERHVYAITDAGRDTLRILRSKGLNEIVMRPDPFDLAMTRLDHDKLDDLPANIAARLVQLTAMHADAQAQRARADPYVTVSERFVLSHRAARLAAEISWHEELVAILPTIIADESARTEAS